MTVATLAALALTGVAFAAPQDGSCQETPLGIIICEKSTTWTDAGRDRRASPSPPAAPADGRTWVPYLRWGTTPEGGRCSETAYKEAGTVAPDEVGPQAWDSGVVTDPGTYPPCPRSQSTAPPAADTPAAFAARYWEQVPLPAPEPRIAPGWGITGKLLYLETGGRTTFTHSTSQTPFGPLEIRARGVFVVDWGDGHTSGPHPEVGRPWPTGTITHTYRDPGTYDVVVRERWVATWHFGAESGVLRELSTTATIADFPLRELQAVVVAGSPSR